MSITRREFERQNAAELLPSSIETYALGDIWDWEYDLLLFNPRLEYKGDNIANIIGDEQLYQALQNQPLVNALIPDVDFTSDIKAGLDLKIPSLNNLDISGHINNNSITQFSFGKVMGKSITPIRSKINKGLEQLKNTDFAKYRRSISGYEIVIGFFYSDNVVLKVNKAIADTASLKAELTALGLDFDFATTVDGTTIETITIKTASCPFAAQFINGREM